MIDQGREIGARPNPGLDEHRQPGAAGAGELDVGDSVADHADLARLEPGGGAERAEHRRIRFGAIARVGPFFLSSVIGVYLAL